MKPLKEKIALLTRRWNELHKVPDVRELSVEDLRKAKNLLLSNRPFDPKVIDRELPKADDLDSEIEKRLERMRKVLFGNNLIVPPEGTVNSSIYLQDLRAPITWIGNIAVGELKAYKGWWGAVPPIGFMFSYAGEKAKERAFEIAEKFKDLWI